MIATMEQTAELNIPGYRVRSYRRDDLAAAYEMMLARARHDGWNHPGTFEDAQREYDDPWCNPEADARVVENARGEIIALARTFAHPDLNALERVHLFGEIHPAYRGRGIGASILEWLIARGRERLLPVRGMRPVALRTFAVDSAQDAVALFESRGFQPVRVSYRMWRDLREPIPNLALPQGMTLRNYGADIDRPLMEAHDEAFSDHWGHEPMTEADWRIFVIGRSSFRRDLTLVAMDGEQIAGFSINRYSPEENAVDGVNAAWIGSLGTRRAYRQRGIASALLCESMRAFHAMGCDYAALGVDSENLTGALRLYERVGFFVRKRFVTFDKIVE